MKRKAKNKKKTNISPNETEPEHTKEPKRQRNPTNEEK